MRWTDLPRWASHALAQRDRLCSRFLILCGLGASLSTISSAQQQPALPPHVAASVQPQFLLVLDAAHGGSDSGAHLASHLDEKDLVLTLSIRRRSMLSARGISVITTRETDLTLPPEKRAALANGHNPAACLILHASD